uniref:Uncharacterized protein n=1 Tax=Avena sativa TaxID=4498 RepID=A0ACD5WZN7_AVESA
MGVMPLVALRAIVPGSGGDVRGALRPCVLLTIANFSLNNEASQHSHTTKEASIGHTYASQGGSDYVTYVATHASLLGKPYDEYYGFVATIDVYGYNISRGQMSVSAVWIANVGNGSKESYNDIQVGWMVSPIIYGDSHTHFYTHWTRDGYVSGCYNMECPGFQLEQGSKIFPGDIISSTSTTGGSGHTITIKVFKDKSSQNWWLYCGINDETPTAVGYYPANIFTTLAEKANSIAFGGGSRAIKSLTTPPMGSGSLPSSNAAFISNLQYVDQDGQVTLIQSDLPIIAANPKCYYVSPIVGSKFSYGAHQAAFSYMGNICGRIINVIKL